MLDILCQSDC